MLSQDKEVEVKVYEHMSLLSCAVGFSWSKWSSEVGEQQFVVKACECVAEQVSIPMLPASRVVYIIYLLPAFICSLTAFLYLSEFPPEYKRKSGLATVTSICLP